MQLKAHFTAGRLDMDEYDERLQQAFGARAGAISTTWLRIFRPRAPPPLSPRLACPYFVPGAYCLGRISRPNTAVGVAHGFFFPWWIIPIGFFVLSRHWRRRWYWTTRARPGDPIGPTPSRHDQACPVARRAKITRRSAYTRQPRVHARRTAIKGAEFTQQRQ